MGWNICTWSGKVSRGFLRPHGTRRAETFLYQMEGARVADPVYMSRHEAKGVPNLLVAPDADGEHRNGNVEDEGQMLGYYADGAYIAYPDSEAEIDEDAGGEVDGDGDQDPQEAYYAVLLDRFAQLRSTLLSPPPEILSGVDYSPPPASVALDPGASFYQWRLALLSTSPGMRLLARTPQAGVMRGLARLESPMKVKHVMSQHGGRYLGAWAWGLLAACRGLETLDSEDVAVLRSLAKKALWLARRLRALGERDSWCQEEDDDQGAEEDTDGLKEDREEECGGEREDLVSGSHSSRTDGTGPGKEDSRRAVPVTEITEDDTALPAHELERRRAVLLNAIRDASPVGEPLRKREDVKGGEAKSRALATLDIVVTIVGEVYGQRDLLDSRASWG
jgi:hypothetical protein